MGLQQEPQHVKGGFSIGLFLEGVEHQLDIGMLIGRTNTQSGWPAHIGSIELDAKGWGLFHLTGFDTLDLDGAFLESLHGITSIGPGEDVCRAAGAVTVILRAVCEGSRLPHMVGDNDGNVRADNVGEEAPKGAHVLLVRFPTRHHPAEGFENDHLRGIGEALKGLDHAILGLAADLDADPGGDVDLADDLGGPNPLVESLKAALGGPFAVFLVEVDYRTRGDGELAQPGGPSRKRDRQAHQQPGLEARELAKHHDALVAGDQILDIPGDGWQLGRQHVLQRREFRQIIWPSGLGWKRHTRDGGNEAILTRPVLDCNP